MNVACTACPAKYAVPDERVRGKRARITCKHCGTSIIVDGTSLGPSDGSSVVAQRPARKTMLGMGTVKSAPLATSNPLAASSPLASTTSNAPPSGGSAWLVALSDGRREPASQARIVDLYAAGTIDASTYIWREGMADWKTPFLVPEVAAALNARGLHPQQRPAPSFTADEGYDGPDEATKVAITLEDALRPAAAAAAAAKPSRAPTRPPAARTPAEDDDGITIARSGPPSSPISLPPPRTTNEPARPSPRPPPPSAVRNPLPAPPPSRVSSEAPSPAGRRPRAHTLPGDLVIPLTGPGAPPPTPLFAPRGQPFARRTPSSSPPGPMISAPPTAMINPSNPVLGAPPAPPLDPVSPVLSAPPAPVVSEAPTPLIGAPVAPAASPSPWALSAQQPPAPAAPNAAPARNPAEFEVPPRSAAPVSVPLDYANRPQRRRRVLAAVLSLGALGVVGVAVALYLRPPSAQPQASAAVPTPPPPVAAPAPAPAPPTAPVAPSATAEATPSPTVTAAEEAKPIPRERSTAVPQRTTASTRALSARKAEPKSESAEASADTEAAATAETAAEAAPELEEAAQKPESAPGNTPFDRESAANALGDAALRAVTCKMLGGPTGPGQATVTFSPSGSVATASVGGEFAGTMVGACITKLFRSLTVPAFSGEAVTVAKRFTVD